MARFMDGTDTPKYTAISFCVVFGFFLNNAKIFCPKYHPKCHIDTLEC